MPQFPLANYDAERGVLVWAIRNPDQIKVLADVCTSNDFMYTSYRDLYEALISLDNAGVRPDIITISDELARRGHLEDFSIHGSNARGLAALSELRDMPVVDGMSCISVIKEQSARRRLLRSLEKAANQLYRGRRVSDTIFDLRSELAEIPADFAADNVIYTASDAAKHAIKAAAEAAGQGRVVETGLSTVDKVLYPQKTELIIVAARPGMGKSALMNTIAINAAKRGKKVLLFVLEMGHTLVAQRMLSQLSGIDAFRIQQGRLTNEEWKAVNGAELELAAIPLMICDKAAISIGEIRRIAYQHAPDVIIVDYLQLVASAGRWERRDLEVGEVVRGLAALAVEMDIPIFAAAQMNRAIESRADGRPTLSDLGESSELEKAASSVVFLRPYPEKEDQGIYLLEIAKHRNGPLGKIPVFFSKKTVSFHSLQEV